MAWASQVVLVVKNPFAKAGDRREAGSISELGMSPGGRHGSPLWYSCPENPMDIGAWQTTVHRVAKSWTQLKWLSMHVCMHTMAWRHLTYSAGFFNQLLAYMEKKGSCCFLGLHCSYSSPFCLFKALIASLIHQIDSIWQS